VLPVRLGWLNEEPEAHEDIDSFLERDSVTYGGGAILVGGETIASDGRTATEVGAGAELSASGTASRTWEWFTFPFSFLAGWRSRR
jgi:hypothetical protein